MEHEVKKSKYAPDEWVVEAIDYAGEGVIRSALFSGPDAEKLAREYAAWRKGDKDRGKTFTAARFNGDDSDGA